MKIKTEIFEDGSIACETETATRHYRSRYRGYSLREARRKFTARVIKAEQEELDRVRLEAIAMCLQCKVPMSKCKGTCKFKPKDGRKLPRGKGAII